MFKIGTKNKTELRSSWIILQNRCWMNVVEYLNLTFFITRQIKNSTISTRHNHSWATTRSADLHSTADGLTSFSPHCLATRPTLMWETLSLRILALTACLTACACSELPDRTPPSNPRLPVPRFKWEDLSERTGFWVNSLCWRRGCQFVRNFDQFWLNFLWCILIPSYCKVGTDNLYKVWRRLQKNTNNSFRSSSITYSREISTTR